MHSVQVPDLFEEDLGLVPTHSVGINVHGTFGIGDDSFTFVANDGTVDSPQFVSFNMVVVTERWGGNVYNSRAQFLDFGPDPMGIVLTLAGDNVAEQLPPLFFRFYGWN